MYEQDWKPSRRTSVEDEKLVFELDDPILHRFDIIWYSVRRPRPNTQETDAANLHHPIPRTGGCGVHVDLLEGDVSEGRRPPIENQIARPHPANANDEMQPKEASGASYVPRSPAQRPLLDRVSQYEVQQKLIRSLRSLSLSDEIDEEFDETTHIPWPGQDCCQLAQEALRRTIEQLGIGNSHRAYRIVAPESRLITGSHE